MKRLVLLLLLMILTISPLESLACGPDYYVNLYEPYRISRNLHDIYIDDPSDYYAYFFSDKLSPSNFYPAYRYLSGKPLSSNNLDENSHYSKCGGNYLGCVETPDDQYSDYDLNASSAATYDSATKWLNRDSQLSSKLGVGNINIQLASRYSMNPFNGCYQGTFDNAVAISERAERELDDEEMRVWMQNQRLVLYNCFSDLKSDYYTNLKKTANLNDCETEIKNSKLGQETQNDTKLSWWQRIIVRPIMSFFGRKNNSVESAPHSNVSDIAIKYPESASDKLKPYLDYQLATYYLYKASSNSNRCNYQKAQQEFSKIATNKNHPFYISSQLGYIRSLYRETALFDRADVRNDALEPLKKDLLTKIDANLADSNLNEIKDSLLLTKESLLANYPNKEELSVAEKSLSENPLQNYSHNLAILSQQVELIKDQHPGDDYSEFARYVTYWNSAATNESISEIRSIYENSGNKELWSILLMKKMKEVGGESVDYSIVDRALSSSANNLYYQPMQYYANSLLLSKDASAARINIRRIADDQKTPDIAYNYFSNLAMNSANELSEAIRYMKRKNTYSIYPFDIEYSWTRIHGDNAKNVWDTYDFGQSRKDRNKDDAFLTFLNRYVPTYTLANNEYLLSEYSGRLFTRAFILGDKDLYLKLLPVVAANDPNIKPALDVNDDLTKNFIITQAILKDVKKSASDYYGIVLNNGNHNFSTYGRDNFSNENDWYLDGEFIGDTNMDNFSKKFLISDELDLAAKEYKVLAVDSIGKIFAENILNFAEVNKSDSRVPESLSKLTNFRKLHHRDSDDSFPEKAFRFLHLNYPGSVWSELTPYYY